MKGDVDQLYSTISTQLFEFGTRTTEVAEDTGHLKSITHSQH